MTIRQAEGRPSSIGADGTNGVLKPATFTGANAASATIESIAWEPLSERFGIVKVKISTGSSSGAGPRAALAGHVVEFIELDGSVSLSLVASEAREDTEDGTLTWTTTAQPWEDGDKLMVRIRKSLAPAPRPSGLIAVPDGSAFNITWDAVANTVRYGVQSRIPDPEMAGGEKWVDVATDVEGTSYRYEPAGEQGCSAVYFFRVRAFGDGVRYEATWGVPSWEWTELGLCNTVPEFGSESFAFEVSESAAVGDSVGVVDAVDPDYWENVTYSITSGNDAGKFAIAAGTGAITVAGALDYEAVSSYTLAVEASDGRNGTATATAEVAVTDVAEDAPPAPDGMSASLADGSFTIAWDAMTGADQYDVEHRVKVAAAEWSSAGTTAETTLTYSPSDDPACGTTYEFRVRARGDGETYTVEWGEPSTPASVTTGACNRAPEFSESSYSFAVSEDASVGASVGTVTTTDPDDGDTVSYSITAGNDAGAFALGASTGAITTAGALDYEANASYTLTVKASDGRGGTATASVGVSAPTCESGTAVPQPESNALLVGDCAVLLGLRDALAGTGTLNWRADRAITDWDGVTVDGTPKRVTGLTLGSKSLTGSLPPALGDLSALERLRIYSNSLTGGIPSELGNLTALTDLRLYSNSLTGGIPSTLGNLTKLQQLYLSSNDIGGEIPATLGELTDLENLLLHSNSLTGTIPSALGKLTSLNQLSLHANELSGEIPGELGGLSELTSLSIERNNLTGHLPRSLGDLTSLTSLRLHSNDLSGPIPWELGNLSNLRLLQLGTNNWEGCLQPSLQDIESNDFDQIGIPYCTENGPAPAPSGLSASVSGSTFALTWGAVAGAGRYEVEYRIRDADDEWSTAGKSATTGLEFSPDGGPVCGTTYEFRVRAYGDGATYAGGWGPPSDTASVTTGACS